ncbi:Uncharacterised protein g7254 [Pycnogonum litorale]
MSNKGVKGVIEFYAAEKTIIQRYQDPEVYEKVLLEADYNGPRISTELLLSLNLDKNVRILDLLGGSGLIACLLKENGYHNIDVLDASEDMMNAARQNNLYKNYYEVYLAKDNPMPIAEDTYDAIVMAGTFTPGHITSDIFEDMIRVVKPGGYVIWSMRHDHVTKGFLSEIDRLCSHKKWKKVRMDYVPNYLSVYDGLVAIFKVV